MDTREYVKNARASREQGVRAMLAALEAGEEFEGQDASDAIDELPLSVELVRHVVITLSVGGPHEEIDATVTDDGEVISATFRAVWGSDSKETRLVPTDALWTLAERYAEVFGSQGEQYAEFLRLLDEPLPSTDKFDKLWSRPSPFGQPFTLATLHISDDPEKTDLELTCDKCGEVICDAQDGDSLECLILTARGHGCEPSPDFCRACGEHISAPHGPQCPEDALNRIEWVTRQWFKDGGGNDAMLQVRDILRETGRL